MRIKSIVSLLISMLAVISVISMPINAEKLFDERIDTKNIVQLYFDGELYKNSKGENINGLIYADFSYPDELSCDLKMAKFNDGTVSKYYTGFTKDKNGKRYYDKGKRIYGWYKIEGNWYHFDMYNGYMSTGKTKICGTTYSFDNSGKWNGKLTKSGLVPDNFGVSFINNNNQGFNTNEKKIYYGNTENGIAGNSVKISKRDLQVLYCMYLESGFKPDTKNVFDEQYMIDFLEENYGEYGYYITISSIFYDINIHIGGNNSEIIFNLDDAQIYMYDINVYNAKYLYEGYSHFFTELKNKYPYTGNEPIIMLE